LSRIVIQPSLVNAASFPFIAFLKVTFPNQVNTSNYSVGSGTLIAPRVVLTAGHVLYERAQGGLARRVELVFGGQGNLAYRGIRAETTQQWVDVDSGTLSPVSAFDYGVVVLPQPIDNLVTPLPFETSSAAMLASATVNIAGYPVEPRSTLGQLYGAHAGVSQHSATRLFYPIATRPGISGGPAYTVDPTTGLRTLRGVHTALVNDQGTALRINEDVFRMINEWVLAFRPGA